ncbi:MAG: response regulator [Chloroflexi bacterium]|nr:response regulator [Chloroflexota bacterium]
MKKPTIPQNPQSKFLSLRGKLTLLILLIGILPIIIIGFISYSSYGQSVTSAKKGISTSEQKLSDGFVGLNLQNIAHDTAKEVDEFFESTMADVIASAKYSLIVDATQESLGVAEEYGFSNVPKEDIQRVMVSAHNKAPNASADNYLALLDMDHPATEHILQMKSSSRYFIDLFFTDVLGYNASVTGPTERFVQSDEKWWKDAWNEGISIGDIEDIDEDESTEIWALSIAVRIDNEAGDPVGVMRAVLDIAAIQDIATTNAGKVESGQVLIVTENGSPLAETASEHDPKRIMNKGTWQSDNEVRKKVDSVFNASTRNGSELIEDSMIGFARSASADYYSEIEGFNGFSWAVIVEQPQEVAFALLASLNELENDLSNSQRATGMTILVVAIGMVLIGILIAFSVSRSITRPMNRLRSATEQFRMGNEDIVIDIDSKDEVGDLAKAFNRMLSERKLANEALRTERDYSTGIVERTPAVIVGIAPDGSVTFINPAGEEITGYNSEELIDKNWWQTFHPGDEYKQVKELFQVLHEGGDTHNYEMTLTAKDGEKHTCEWNIIERFDESGEIVEIIAFGNNITERKQSEEDLRKANEEINLILENVTSVSQAIVDGDFSKEIELTTEKPELGSALQEMIRILKGVVDQANTIAAGNYEMDIIPRSEMDELGIALQNMTQALREMKQVNYKQLWFAERQARLNDVMRGEQDIPDLARNLTGYLAKTLNAQMATLYVLNPEDNKLLLVGSYAFTHRKGNPGMFELGEGLVGQAALEKELIVFSNIPEDYIKIGSSLGDTIPRNIMVIPFLYDGNTTGVIELASVEEFSDDTIAFLNSVMESIAIAVNSAEARVKMQELLHYSQEQAEQLQFQEQELRTANEELTLKTEKLEASEKGLKSQREELQATNEELEEKTQKLQTSQTQLTAQQEQLQAANEELEEKTFSLEKQREEVFKKNEQLEIASQELELRAEDLRLASKYKSEFLANMSHELRTPLNSLLVLAQDLASNKTGNLDEDQMESADIIHKSGQDLLTLINEILDLSKIEAGKMPVNICPVLLPDIANSINTNFKHVMAGRGVELIINVDESIPETIETDQQRLLQIIKNLMSNAIKFTDTGSITVDFFKPAANANLSRSGLDQQQTIGISVTDTGVGIPKEKQKPIFEAFQQADGSTSRQYGGTGLGLSISRELARLLGGEIQLESEENKGSKFTIFIPAEMIEPDEADEPSDTVSAKSTEQPQTTESNMASVKIAEPVTENDERKSAPSIKDDRDVIEGNNRVILVIEDDLNWAKTLYKFCHQRNFKCLHAGDGETGLQLAEQYQPTAIVLDIRLPGLDGWGVLELLKDNSNTRHIPVHMMSASEESIDAYKKGVIGFLTKPIDSNQLDDAFTKIEDVISRDVKELLIIEKDAKLRKNIAKLIGDDDVNTTAVGSGKQALDELRSKTYDCMILDLALSDISGFDVLKQMNDSEDISAPPVVVYAGRELTPDEELKLQMYAGSIMVKGVKSEDRLLDETALFLHRVIDDLPAPKKEIITRLHDKDSIFEGKKILLVDDDMRNVFALSKVMEGVGMEIIKASNGKKALEALEKDADVDLVLMDIMMPVMDGYEAMHHIRDQERFADLPILALTAKAMVDDREKCIAAGANDYMPKPVDVERLLSLIRVWLYK